MTYRTRIKYTAEQKAEIWNRWQRGESLKAIGLAFDGPLSAAHLHISLSGGPPLFSLAIGVGSFLV